MAGESVYKVRVLRDATYNSRPSCEIYSVPHKNTFRWKWRYTDASDAVVDCLEEYELFFECVQAARARGYEPRAKWTACARLTAAK
jgi:hypothetical protein